MDRTLGFYQSPKVLTLVPVEKQYSTMYMNEHGKDVMILKFVNGKSVFFFFLIFFLI